MRRKLVIGFTAISLGLIFTFASVAFARTSDSQSCSYFGFQLQDVERGLPLPYLTIKPSTSLCNSVEPLSVLWTGNAYHEQSIVNAAIDVVVWSLLSGVGILGFERLIKRDRLRRSANK